MSVSDRETLAHRQSNLSPAKRALLARWKRGESAQPGQEDRIPRCPDPGSAPLAFAQQRLWFLDQLDPGSPAYNQPALVRLEGELDPGALERAFAEIVERHEILRTAFAVRDGEPRQRIVPRVAVPLPIVDLRRLPPAAARAEADRRIRGAARRPFDLARPPLLRTLLVRLDRDEHLLLLAMHHIVTDGWSDGILIRELGRLYPAYRAGRPSPLPALPVQYADYAHWQRQWLRGPVLDKLLAYWKEQLAGPPPVLELPCDRPRPAVQQLRGARLPVRLDAALTAGLKIVGRDRETTLFMTLLAALRLLLGRITGQRDFCVGSPIANRRRSEIEELIGFFVNTLVLRADLWGNPAFRALLDQVRRVTLSAYAHQELPFGVLVEELSPERDLSHSPLVQVLFALQNAPGEALELPGLTLHLQEIDDGTAKFDLSLYLTEAEEGLRGFLEYDADLFDRTTAARLVEHFRTLLAEIVRDPERGIAELPLLGRAERRQLLAEWNDTAAELPGVSSWLPLFAAQVERTPEAVALGCGRSQLSYRELDRRSRRLARRLRRLGVAPGVLVAICVERSPAMLVGLLGILKAGGAYVPLDPAHPRQRLEAILDDTRAPVLLSQQQLVPALPDYGGERVLLGPGPLPERREPDDGPPCRVGGGDLAYVIYTSGSTGRPKGVQISHRALLNFLTAMRRRPGLGPDDVLVAVTTLAFDIAALELYLPLMVGARLEIASRETAADGARLRRLLAGVAATAMQATPVTWRLLLAAGWPGDARFAILCGGEALPEELAAELAGRRGRLWNLYGPTETTVWSTLAEVGPGAGPITLGRPIANTEVYLLDRRLQPVPSGAAGELHLGGAGLARGYLGRPALSAERFVPHAFSDTPGARLYRTGDLVRCRADGGLEFLQRIDHQVKIRGFRIELGDVEAALDRHPGIQQAVVTAREDRLLAYLVARGEPAPPAGALREFLRQRLPDYMLPAACVFLPAFPLTASGKVDRRALPAPDLSRSELGEGFVGPRTPVEEMLTAIWGELLGRDRVGVHDSFFELGGHSLLATQLLSRVRRAFQREVPVRRLFEVPTVAGLARELESDDEQAPAPPLVPVPRAGDLPLSFAQQRLWVLNQLEPGDPAYNIPSAVRLRGRLEVPALAAGLDEVVRRHESLRTRFTALHGKAVQVIAAPSPAALPEVDLGSLSPDARQRTARALAFAEARRAFDLTRGPLLRPGLLRLAEDEHILLLTMHHIISDAWSAGVLLRELAALYEAFQARRRPRLPAPEIQYPDFAHWQRQWLQGEVRDRQLAYWTEQLADPPAPLTLPTDRPRPAVWTSRGALHRFRLPSDLADGLKRFSREQGATPYMTLLGALEALLYRTTGQEELAVGSPIANRGHSEIEGLIGFFVNTLVMRADLSGDPSFRGLLERVRRTALEAYAHQDLPFEVLVEALTPERDLSRTPFFQVMFVLQNVPMPRFELPGLVLEPLEIDSGAAKFDLSLQLEERAESLSGWLEYSTELFDAPTIGRLSGHYRRLLEGIVADGGRRLSEHPLMSEAERFELVTEWNATARRYPRELTLDELFARQVERTPDAVAVVCEGRVLSYRELDRRTDQLAAALRRLGVGVEVVVGVLMERSPELVVSLLGIVKAGGAYLPLEPSYPRERLAFMLADARVPVVLSLERLRDRVPAEASRVLWVDSLPAAAGPAPAPASGADHLAYTIYTSGSTGQPKGSMISHRGIVNRLLWMQEAYGLEPGEGVLQKTPFSFDVSVWEFFWPPIVGARLVVARPGGHQDSRYLAELIAREQVTTLHFVPSMLHVFLDEPLIAKCSSLKRVISSGEALPYELQERFFTRLGAELHNLYGPTEAAVDVTFQPCRPHPSERSVPIGRPIANIRIYLLDRRGHPVPVGWMGELVIAGVGLARGYLGRPDLTADRFVPDPFSQEPGGRLYRTGDQARWRPGGAIEYLGRFDHQVKVRGFRIELGEIEAALVSHPAIREVVVLARREAASSGPRLVAYLVAGTERPAVAALRNLLKERLPEYMVPAAFVFLEAMPLMPNGKVDRRALPAPDESRPELEEAWVAPRTPNEEILAEIWSRMLGVEKVGINDSFFDLGGDSILGIQVVARAQEAGLRLAPRDLFQYKTIVELAAVAVAQPTAEAEQGKVTGTTPLTPIQRWFFAGDRPQPHHFNQAVLLEALQPLEPPLVERALARLPEHHDALRLRFDRDGGEWRQVHADGDGAPLVRIDLSALAEDSAPAALRAAEALQASLDLARGPLWRVALFDRGSQEASRLLWIVHHLAVDGVSWRVLLDDLERAYRQLERGEPLVLPPKTTSFKAWARRIEAYARSEALAEERSYWLDGPWERAEPLPSDFPEGVNTVASTRTVAVELEAEETRRLLQEVPAAYHTQIHEVLLAALVKTLTSWTGSDTLLVDLEGHGREELGEGIDLSRTVGWFTALYPVLLELGEAWGPGEELMVVKEKLRAVPNGGTGYGLLRYLSEDEEAQRLRRLPAAGVLFNYLGQLDPAFSDTSPWRPVREPAGSVTGSGGMRNHPLEINGGISDRRLRLRWSFSGNLHRRATVEGLAEGFLEALRLFIDHCLSPEAGAYTPADFPEAKIDQEDLDKLFGQIKHKDQTAT